MSKLSLAKNVTEQQESVAYTTLKVDSYHSHLKQSFAAGVAITLASVLGIGHMMVKSDEAKAAKTPTSTSVLASSSTPGTDPKAQGH